MGRRMPRVAAADPVLFQDTYCLSRPLELISGGQSRDATTHNCYVDKLCGVKPGKRRRRKVEPKRASFCSRHDIVYQGCFPAVHIGQGNANGGTTSLNV